MARNTRTGPSTVVHARNGRLNRYTNCIWRIHWKWKETISQRQSTLKLKTQINLEIYVYMEKLISGVSKFSNQLNATTFVSHSFENLASDQIHNQLRVCIPRRQLDQAVTSNLQNMKSRRLNNTFEKKLKYMKITDLIGIRSTLYIFFIRVKRIIPVRLSPPKVLPVYLVCLCYLSEIIL